MEGIWERIKPYVYGAGAGFIVIGILFLILKSTPEPILKEVIGEQINLFKSNTVQTILKIGGIVVMGAIFLWLMMGRPRKG